MKKMFLGLLCAVALAGCGKDMSTDGGRPSQAQQTIDNARTTLLVAGVAVSTYNMLTPCDQTARSICKDPAVSAQITAALATAAAALDVAQAAINAGENPSTIEKARLAAAAAVTALKILQQYGVG